MKKFRIFAWWIGILTYNKKLHIILDLGDKKKPHRIILIFLRKIQFDLSYDIFVEICNFKIIPE